MEFKGYIFDNEKQAQQAINTINSSKLAQIKGFTKKWCDYFKAEEKFYLRWHPSIEIVLGQPVIIESPDTFYKSVKALSESTKQL